MRTLAAGGGEPTSHGPEKALWHVSILVSGGGAGRIGIDFIFHCDLSAGPGGYRSCIPRVLGQECWRCKWLGHLRRKWNSCCVWLAL